MSDLLTGGVKTLYMHWVISTYVLTNQNTYSVQVILTYKMLGGCDYQYYDSMFQQPIRYVRQRDLNHKQNEC